MLVILPIHPDYSANKKWVDLVSCIHGSPSYLAWLVLISRGDAESYVRMLDDAHDAVLEATYEEECGLDQHEYTKRFNLIDGSLYSLTVMDFHSHQTRLYQHSLGDLFHRYEPLLSVDQPINNALIVNYYPNEQHGQSQRKPYSGFGHQSMHKKVGQCIGWTTSR